MKSGVADPDTGNDIGGWQGRISAIFEEEETLTIQWDSVTLKKIPPEHIAWCEEEGLSWSEMNLSLVEVEPGAVRDNPGDVTATIAKIASQSNWLHLGGAQGQRIQAIVNRAESQDLFAVLSSWHAYLEKHLVFPFAAIVQEYQRGPIRQGARITVVAISSLDEMYGTTVMVKMKQGVSELPLCDLKATDAPIKTQQLVEDYAMWFANR
ncbi:hypothetical protein KDW_06740 [Dictyobacter vulcani]|uniref:Uncharacterized protein n=1 Tax=Dictyobacter vulcani TaxID=2607529 RepID=A0A5J4KHZ3_9CHLR|nr:calcium-binding protein [Dictyobacter vulcani]GER86512.1 hypothetical protein KDW_06740 [Dictyobacter vulcani]